MQRLLFSSSIFHGLLLLGCLAMAGCGDSSSESNGSSGSGGSGSSGPATGAGGNCADCGPCGIAGPVDETFISTMNPGAVPGGAAYVPVRLELTGTCVGEAAPSYVSFEGGTVGIAAESPAEFDSDLVSYADGTFAWSDRDLEMTIEQPGGGDLTLVFVEASVTFRVACTHPMDMLSCKPVP